MYNPLIGIYVCAIGRGDGRDANKWLGELRWRGDKVILCDVAEPTKNPLVWNT